MPFHLFIYGVVLPWWYQGCHWLQLNWMMQRNKKEAETDDQKRSITSTSLSVWMSECVCVRVCCIHCLVDWPLETSFVPHSDKLWNHQDTTAVQDLSGARRESGALQSFDRISQKQVGVEPFATVFWKTKRDGVEDSTHHDLQTHIGDKSRFTLQDKHVWFRYCLLLADAWTGKRVSESVTHSLIWK